MAIKVTGYFQNPTTGLIHQSPLLTLVPHLTYRGGMTMDVHIDNGGTVAYQSIDKNVLVYNPEITDGYSQLIDALETYVINHLQASNDVNAAATFEHYVAPVIEPTTEPTDPTTEGGEVTPDYMELRQFHPWGQILFPPFLVPPASEIP